MVKWTVKMLVMNHKYDKLDLWEKTSQEIAECYGVSEATIKKARRRVKEEKEAPKRYEDLLLILERGCERQSYYGELLREILNYYAKNRLWESYGDVAVAAKGFYFLAVEEVLDPIIGKEARTELYGKQERAKALANKEIKVYGEHEKERWEVIKSNFK